MRNIEQFWRGKSDEELIQASTRVAEFTDEGRQAIISELQRRGLEHPSQEEHNEQQVEKIVATMEGRYSDVYRVADAVTGAGSAIKVFGTLFALAVIALGIFGLSDFAIIFLVVGFIVGVLFWGVGVFVSALGQILRTSVDTAVNTSPFLNNADKAYVMGFD